MSTRGLGLGRVEGAGAIALAVVAGLFAAYMLVEMMAKGVGVGAEVLGIGLLIFLCTALIGAPLVILYGAPVYWLLARHGLATWPSAAVVGVLPGLVLLSLDPWFGGMSTGCGLVVAMLTHWRCQQPLE